MTDHPTPGQPLTGESVGLLKAGRINTNSGHGHAWPRPDGVRMRCGGPRVCAECAKDKALVDDVIAAAQTPTSPPIEDAERGALEAVMRSVDPATWSGLTANERAALGRFAKPANQSRTDPVSDVEVREAVAEGLSVANQHIQHMAAWITKTNASDRPMHGYSFEALGEDKWLIDRAMALVADRQPTGAPDDLIERLTKVAYATGFVDVREDILALIERDRRQPKGADK